MTNIPGWKFESIRRGILAVLENGPHKWSDLKDSVRTHLTADELDRMGSLSWHLITVKLELEVRGEIQRQVGSGPQILSLK